MATPKKTTENRDMKKNLNHLERQYLKFYKYECACKDPVKKKALFKQVVKLSKILCEAKQRND